MKTNPIGLVFNFAAGAALPFSVYDLAEQVGHSLTGKYPTGAFSDSARPLRRGTESKGWTTYGFPPSLKNIPPEYFLRYARKSRTAAHLERARLRRILRRALVPLRPVFPFSVHDLAEQVGHSLTGKYPTGVFSKSARLPFMLGLRICRECLETTASRVSVFCGSGAQCGSTTCFFGADLRARARARRIRCTVCNQGQI